MYIILTKTEILIYDNESNELMMKGVRSSSDKMWYLNLDQQDQKLQNALRI